MTSPGVVARLVATGLRSGPAAVSHRYLLGIDLGLRRCVVARTGHRARIDEVVETRDRLRIQLDRRPVRVLLEVVEACGAGNRHDVLASCEQPRERQLT